MTLPRRPDEPTVAVVIPIRALHEQGEPVVVRRPGRPRRVETAPTLDEEVYMTHVSELAERAILQDEVVVASGGSDARRIVEATIVATAQEAAALHFDRMKAQRDGGQAARVSSRRVQALLRVAELVILKEQLARDSGDLDPAHVTQAVEMLLDCVREVVEDVATPEIAERFMSRLQDKMTEADFPTSACTQRTAP